MRRKDVLTTGEVAKVCNVAPRTVSKWFDTGKLRGYRIPGSRDRRIPIEQLIKFMRAHGMPLNGLEGGELRVLVVDDDNETRQLLTQALETRDKYQLQTASNGFEAGMSAERFVPHVILLDLMLHDLDGRELCRNIKSNPALAATRVVAVGGQLTSMQGKQLLSEGFDGYLTKPFGITEVLEAVEQASNIIS